MWLGFLEHLWGWVLYSIQTDVNELVELLAMHNILCFKRVRMCVLVATFLLLTHDRDPFPSIGSSKQSPQRRRWHCRAESVDANETVAAGEQKVSQAKESLTEKQGPPVLTILAGLVVAVVVIWGLWSLVSAILGIFFH